METAAKPQVSHVELFEAIILDRWRGSPDPFVREEKVAVAMCVFLLVCALQVEEVQLFVLSSCRIHAATMLLHLCTETNVPFVQV